ncbi:hypothetical protein Sango_1596500 [Sesamum angolense]|uniref:Uncharacterized protein n=1 Tax=Sesamum angolense TaxID=2727404 RepID=A0AAE1WQE5_9LAMI|nr:hypothetical protein Sango_1596500 [Sesamum angolense]
MLAKQRSRILKQLELLVSRILPARYFPAEGFLKAKRMSNMSFTWRSILGARGVVEAGLRWSISYDLIEFLFQSEDAKIIRSIPLDNFSLADTQIWHFDRHSVFSVKPAYHVAYKVVTDLKPYAAEHSNKTNVSWSLIWHSLTYHGDPWPVGMEVGRIGFAMFERSWNMTISTCSS